jgi:hypothetical protein
MTPWITAFVKRLRELGWIEGRTVSIEYRWAEGRNERYAEIANEFVGLKVGGVGSDADELSHCEVGRARRASCFQATARALLCKLPHHGWRTVWLKSGTHLNDHLFRYRLRAARRQSRSNSSRAND